MNLSFLHPLYARPGPWASAYLDASHNTEDAPARVALRWRAAREQLQRQGTDRASLDALERVVLEHPTRPGRYGLAAFAAGGDAPYVQVLAEPPVRQMAVLAPLPHAMPLVVQRGERIGWLRVVVDHTGADIIGATEGGLPRTSHVRGHGEYPLHKTKPGGWSQPRYQRAAETTWQRNAAEVAKAVTALANAVGAEVLVVAGDRHARPMLIDQLPKRWRSRVVETDIGSRAPGADPEPLDDLTARAVVELATAAAAEALDRFGAQRERGGAVVGLAAVVAALQRAQVDTALLDTAPLVGDPASTQELWIGPQATDIALTAKELRAMTVRPQRVRADAALLRALTGTDAELVLVDRDSIEFGADGMAAVLRYLDPTTVGASTSKHSTGR